MGSRSVLAGPRLAGESGARRLRPAFLTGVVWLPLLAALGHAALVVHHAPEILRSVYWISDMASIPVISEGMSLHAPRQVIWLGSAAHYNDYLFNLATRWLPFHRPLWESWPMILTAGTIVLVAWGAWLAAGRWAGLIALAFGASIGPYALFASSGQGLRAPTWFNCALLALVMTAVASRSSPLGMWKVAAVVTGVGLVTGVNLASDPLLAIAGLAPLLLTGLLGLLLGSGSRRWQPAVVAVGTAVVAVLVAAGTEQVMHWLGFRQSPLYDIFASVRLATPAEAWQNMRELAPVVLIVVGGFLPSMGPAAAAVGAGVVSTLIGLQAWMVARLWNAPRRAFSPAESGRTTYAVFWATASLSTLGLVCVSRLAEGAAGNALRLLPVVFYATAATIAVWAAVSERRRLLVALPILALAAFNVRGQFAMVASFANDPLGRDGPRVIEVLEREHLTRGYSSYWDALGLTWQSGMKVDVSPVRECRPPSTVLCPVQLNSVDAWYRPLPGIASFLVTGPPPGPMSLPPKPPPELGDPVAVRPAGSFTVYVYDYDVGTRLHPAR